MRKSSLAVACAVAAVTLGPGLSVAAQQGGRASGARGRASLDASLDQLERLLKEGTTVSPGYRYAQRTYVRLKRSGGCDVTFRVTRSPGSPTDREPYEPTSQISDQELRVNLSELDPASVELLRPREGDSLVVQFSALGGKAAIRRKVFPSAYDKVAASVGRFEVNEKVAPQAAEALRRAITACER